MEDIMIRRSNSEYIKIYLDYLKGDKTLEEVAIKHNMAVSTVRKYIEYGRNLATSKYNKQFVRAAKLSETSTRKRVFDEDLREFLFNN